MGPPVANLCKLKTDKAIGAQKNFAKTFNWLVDSMKNLQGGTACNVNWVAENMPVIDVNTYVTGDETTNSGGDGEVTLSGTDYSSYTGSEFQFASAQNSNISVSVDASGNITIGCYYV